jgi:hypothetical protein
VTKRAFILLLFPLLAKNLCPQVAEDFAESVDEFSESSEFLDQLADLRKRPVDLNVASVDELLRLPWLTPLMAEEVIRYRDARGGIRDIRELESLFGFDSPLAERMAEFVVIGVAKKVQKKVAIETRSRLKLPPRSQSEYLGARSKLYTRVGISVPDRYAVGLLIEKDSYEKSYADFVSYFIQLTEVSIVRRAAVGYYDLEFAEGLIFSPSDFSIKSQGTIKKGNRGILRARSSDENRSLFGTALTLDLGKIHSSGFFSVRSLDANLNLDGQVRSLDESGLHRSETELEKKDALKERLFGGRLEITGESIGTGLTFVKSEYSVPFSTPAFSGREYGLTGIDVEGRFRKARFFGEAALSHPGGGGILLGGRLSAHRFSTGFLLRYYEDNFWSPHSSAFSECGGENEKGAYCFVRFSTKRGTRVEAYADIFRPLTPREPGEFPYTGREYQVSLYQKVSKALRLQLRFRSKKKPEVIRQSLRLQIDGENGQLRMRIRAELSNSTDAEDGERSTGDMQYFSLTYEPFNQIEFEGRIALFSTESYDARIYMYERDLPGYLRNVALSGQGTRFYILLHYAPRPWLELTVKYATQRREEIREEFGLQLDLLNLLQF